MEKKNQRQSEKSVVFKRADDKLSEISQETRSELASQLEQLLPRHANHVLSLV